MLEMVQAEGGVLPVDPAFVQHVGKLCKEHGLLLIVDEIQTGMGRTGKLFAYEHYGIEPDIFTLAKGLGSGFPVGAMLAKEELIRSIQRRQPWFDVRRNTDCDGGRESHR